MRVEGDGDYVGRAATDLRVNTDNPERVAWSFGWEGRRYHGRLGGGASPWRQQLSSRGLGINSRRQLRLDENGSSITEASQEHRARLECVSPAPRWARKKGLRDSAGGDV